MQMVSLTLRVLHRPEHQALPTIYQNLGLDYDDRVLPSIGNEVLKAIVAQFDAAELITQRELVFILLSYFFFQPLNFKYIGVTTHSK
jgi:prohibitin 1